jgi:hypothetical protein
MRRTSFIKEKDIKHLPSCTCSKCDQNIIKITIQYRLNGIKKTQKYEFLDIESFKNSFNKIRNFINNNVKDLDSDSKKIIFSEKCELEGIKKVILYSRFMILEKIMNNNFNGFIDIRNNLKQFKKETEEFIERYNLTS